MRRPAPPPTPAPPMPARLEREALLQCRNELEAEHVAAVALLEAGTADDPTGGHTRANRRRCVELYDELAAVQKRIDELLARERAGQ